MRKIILPLATATLALVGCSMAPNYERPAESLPSSLGDAATASVVQDVSLNQWWLRFGDATLNSLVERALENNTDLMQSVASVKQARAALGMEKADKWPSLSADAKAARAETPEYQLSAGQPDISNAFQVNGLLSYEVDLFGRVASSNMASREELLSSEYALQSVRSLIASETATTYFNLVAAREQLRLTEKSVETRKNTVRIQEKRFDAGYGTDLERQQALADLANAEVTLPDLKQNIESLQSALRLLVGAGVDEIWNATPIAGVPEMLPEPPAVSWDYLPASILERRPDILAAEASLKAANARIGVARAQRWPTLSLSAILGTADGDVDGLFTAGSRAWTLSGALAGPVYDFGKSKNRVKSAKAQAEMAEWNYRAIVRSAFKELRDAATNSDFSTQSVQARTKQVDAWNRYLEIATSRYDTGYADPLEILDAQRGQFSAQLSLVTARLNRLVAAVELCRALGGGWDVQE